jgi:hypothetical protein
MGDSSRTEDTNGFTGGPGHRLAYARSGKGCLKNGLLASERMPKKTFTPSVRDESDLPLIERGRIC